MIDKKMVIICTIIAVVIIGAFAVIDIKDYISEKNINVDEQNSYVDEQNSESNKLAENVTEENSVVNENNVVANNVEENQTLENATNTETNTNTTSSSSTEQGEDKAISLAKKKWGETDDTVYYNAEEDEEEGIYIVSVRSKSDTSIMAEYKVNTKTEEVSDY